MVALLYITGGLIIIISIIFMFALGNIGILISGFLFSIILFALGKIIENQELILEKLDISTYKVNDFLHIEKIVCPKCHYEYEYDRTCCPKCGHKIEN